MSNHILPLPSAFHEQPEWLRVTLSCIGDGIITTDNRGHVTFLNPVAEALTGWTLADAAGLSLETVFHIVNETTRDIVENPALRALREGRVVGLANHTLLIAKDGTECPIDDSAAPIRSATGEVAGVVLVFRDVTQRKRDEGMAQDALDFADNIIATMREPFLVLDQSLKVVTANESFYENFQVGQADTQGQFVYDLGNRQWDIPALRTLLEEVLPLSHDLQDYEVEHDFPTLGRKTMLLNARRIRRPGNHTELILLAIEDITERKRATVAIHSQNERLHLLGETAETLLFADDPDAMLGGLIKKIGSQLGVDSYRNYLVDDSGEYLRLESCGGISEADARSIQRLEFGESICGTAALRCQAITVKDIQGATDPIHALAKASGCRAYACYPLLVEAQLLGTLSFASQTKDEFAPEELTFLKTMSQYVAVAYSQLRARNVIRASEKRLRFILESMPPKIGTTKPNGEVDYFNPQWCEYTGLPFEQIKGRGWKQVIHPDDVTEHVKRWQEAIRTDRPFEFESRLRRADGEYRWHISRAVPMRDESGQITMWVGSNSDIHDIRQAEVAIHVSENRYRRLFEAAKDGIVILDSSNGKIIDANPFMCSLLGYTQGEFIGKEMWEIGLFRDKSANEAAVRGLQESGYLRYEHMPLVTKTGRQVEVEIVANVYREDQESVIQCNIRDITERSHMEELLRNQSVEMSDLHRRKDEFLAMLSHELRSPLAPIANAVQLLGLQSETETLIHKRARDIIQRQLGQLQHLVDDLLEVSRITTGRVQLRKERVTVNRIVQGAVETTRPLIEQRGHTLTVTILPPPIWLDADPARLEQVIVNLLTNAAKYTEEGGKIHLTAQMEGPECVLRVRDNGVGISPTLLPRIFDLFTQAERSLDRSEGGLGIGLALVLRLTELHGGTVEVQSVLGHGSEFIVRLPLHSDERRVANGEVNGTIEPPHAPLPPQLRVLVVDDNIDTVLSFSMLLQASGHDVRTAHDGLEAVQAALDYRPDVMLLDIGLPGLNGYEVAKQVRQHPQLRDVVLVALTGYGQDSDRATSMQAGFNHHMVKPASFEQITLILSSVPRLPR